MAEETNFGPLVERATKYVIEYENGLDKFSIQSVEHERGCIDHLLAIETLKSEVHAAYDQIIAAIKTSLQAATTTRDAYLKPLEQAKEIIRRALTEYRDKQKQESLVRSSEAILGANAEAELHRMLGNDTEAEHIMASVPIHKPSLDNRFGDRSGYDVEVYDLRALAMAALEGKTDMDAIQPNMKFLNGIARRAKEATSIPGVRVKKKTILVKSKKKGATK